MSGCRIDPLQRNLGLSRPSGPRPSRGAAREWGGSVLEGHASRAPPRTAPDSRDATRGARAGRVLPGVQQVAPSLLHDPLPPPCTVVFVPLGLSAPFPPPHRQPRPTPSC